MDGGSPYKFHLARRQGQWSIRDDLRSSEKLQVNVQLVNHDGGICTRNDLLEMSEKRCVIPC